MNTIVMTILLAVSVPVAVFAFHEFILLCRNCYGDFRGRK